MLIRETVLIATIGTSVGLALSWMLSHLLSAILFGVEPRDPVVFALVPVGTVIVCTLCAIVAASRLARIEPIDALRGSH